MIEAINIEEELGGECSTPGRDESFGRKPRGKNQFGSPWHK
jgi:hypothetical protein